jgi:hypothetical protein
MPVLSDKTEQSYYLVEAKHPWDIFFCGNESKVFRENK